MDKFTSGPSRADTSDTRFTSQAATAEDLLKAQTVGLVNLNDYRKRRAEALDLKERGISSATNSGASTPNDEYEEPRRSFLKLKLICKAQSIISQAHIQEEAQGS